MDKEEINYNFRSKDAAMPPSKEGEIRVTRLEVRTSLQSDFQTSPDKSEDLERSKAVEEEKTLESNDGKEEGNETCNLQSSRRVSWAEDLVTVHVYQEKKKTRFSSLWFCLPTKIPFTDEQ